MDIEVSVEGREPLALRAGQELELGRNEGAGQFAVDDGSVSRRHLVVRAADDCWTLTTTGSQTGVVVHDHETPSILYVPKGVGPVAVPFARSTVAVEVEERRHIITVTSPGAPGWAGAWHAVVSQDAGAEADATGVGGTVLPWDGLGWRQQRTGAPQSWYVTLVAMCEPFLERRPGAAVPSDTELDRRLGLASGAHARGRIGVVRQNLGLEAHLPALRQSMVTLAISQRLVTRESLEVLPPKH